MSKRKYFHITAKGEVKEITGDQWFHILQQRNPKKPRLVVSTYKGDFSLNKGDDHIFIREREITSIIKQSKE